MTENKPYRANPTARSSDAFWWYEDDHTSLVHVLWAEGLRGREADEIAAAILRSRWLKAREHRASGGAMLCENGQPSGHAHVRDASGSRCLK